MSKEQYNKLEDMLKQELQDMRVRKAHMINQLKDCNRALEAIIRMDKIAYPET